MERHASRSKDGVIIEPVPGQSETEGPTDRRVHRSFMDETYQTGDDGGYTRAGQNSVNDTKQKANTMLPVFELCNPEASKLHHYIQSFVIFPRLIITAAHRSLLNVVNELAAMEMAGKGDGRFEFYYLSAGPLGNGYYLSALLFRYSLFEPEPIFPVAFMIHKRQDPDDHRRLFELIQEKCPEVASTKCVFITDREFGDIKSILPSALQFFSWHYFEEDIATWVESNGGTNDEANAYIHDVFHLMKCSTVEKFHREHALKRKLWTLEFAQYFEAYLKQDIISKGGRWHADVANPGTYDPFCGVVIPSCADLNQLVSELVEWQDITLDQLLLCTYYFMEYYVRENEMSAHQSGIFKFKPHFIRAARPIRRLRVFPPAEVNELKDVVNFVKTYSMVSR